MENYTKLSIKYLKFQKKRTIDDPRCRFSVGNSVRDINLVFQ